MTIGRLAILISKLNITSTSDAKNCQPKGRRSDVLIFNVRFFSAHDAVGFSTGTSYFDDKTLLPSKIQKIYKIKFAVSYIY